MNWYHKSGVFKHFWRCVAEFTQDWFSSPIFWLQFLEVSWGEHRLKGRSWSQDSSRSRADVKSWAGRRARSCQLNLLEQPWNRNKPWCKQLSSFFFFFLIWAHFQTASKNYSLLIPLQNVKFSPDWLTLSPREKVWSATCVRKGLWGNFHSLNIWKLLSPHIMKMQGCRWQSPHGHEKKKVLVDC